MGSLVMCQKENMVYMTSNVLKNVFPYHILISPDGEILQMGGKMADFISKALPIDISTSVCNISTLFPCFNSYSILGSGEEVTLKWKWTNDAFTGNVYLLDDRLSIDSPDASLILTLQLIAPSMIHVSKSCDRFSSSDLTSLETDLEDVHENLRKKRMFVRYVSHEIRTPLNVALLGLRCLEEELLSRTANLRCREDEMLDLVEDVKVSCNLAVELLNDLLLYEKIDDGLSGLSITPKTSLRAFLREIEKSFRMQAKGAGICLKFDYENGPQDILVDIDKMKLQQVFRNLFSNAMKFTSSNGSVTISTCLLEIPPCNEENISFANPSVGHLDSKYSQLVRISVCDTGCGISFKDQATLFQQFAQVRAEQLQQGQGSGLGLWIVSKIVALHNGRIGVTSLGEGLGSTFIVDLPVSGLCTVSSSNLYSQKELPPLQIENDLISFPASFSNSQSQISRASCSVSSHLTEGYNCFELIPTQSTSPISAGAISNNFYPSLPVYSSNSATSPSSSTTLKYGSIRFANSCFSPATLRYYTSRMRMLIVDDAPSNRKMVRRLMRDRFRQIDEAENGLNALQMFEAAKSSADPYRIIMMDASMPTMNGLEATKAIKMLNPNVLIIGVTGAGHDDEIAAFASSGADLVLLKPLNVAQFENFLVENLRN